MKTNEFGTPCHFCETGIIGTRFVKDGSGACWDCITLCPTNCHIEDRFNFLTANKKFKSGIEKDDK